MRLAVVLLAAGASKRFGTNNKLLADLNGRPLCTHAATVLRAALPNALVIAVVPVGAAALRDALAETVDTFVENPDAVDGIAGSIRTGIAALPADVDGVLIAQADMPGLTVSFLTSLIDAFRAGDGERIVYPRDAEGRQRTPVIWPRQELRAFETLSGDHGAKAIITSADADGRTQPVDLPAGAQDVLIDIDTPEALAAWRAR